MNNKGKLRNEILKNCPQEFQDELTEWVDLFERRIAETYRHLDEREISEEGAQEAKKQLNKILDELY